MAEYTITIKTLKKNNFKFNLNSYPIFDENYREILNSKILNHYYEYEIGYETPELFNFFLGVKMNEIMPYFNTLYVNQKYLLDNIGNNVNITEEFSRKNQNTTNSKATSNANSNNKNLFQDTPQGKISFQELESQTYATNYSIGKTNNSDNMTAQGNQTGTEDYIKTIKGNNGNKYNYEVLNDIKNNIMNIDMLIINELDSLFMGIF